MRRKQFKSWLAGCWRSKLIWIHFHQRWYLVSYNLKKKKEFTCILFWHIESLAKYFVHFLRWDKWFFVYENNLFGKYHYLMS